MLNFVALPHLSVCAAYAQVLKMLGNGRLEAHCFMDDKKRMGIIRGKMRKKVWVAVVSDGVSAFRVRTAAQHAGGIAG